MAFYQKLFFQTSVNVTQTIVVSKIKTHIVKRYGKNIVFTAYMTYDNLLKIILNKILACITNDKLLIMLLVALV